MSIKYKTVCLDDYLYMLPTGFYKYIFSGEQP